VDDVPVEVPLDIEARVRAVCLSLPEVTMRVDESRTPTRSTAYSYDIRRRSFCLLVAIRSPQTDRPAPRLILRADPGEREALLSMGYPYFAPRSPPDRIGVRLTESTDWEEVRELVVESYRVLAAKKLVALLEEESG
jgi:hypothetical protein